MRKPACPSHSMPSRPRAFATSPKDRLHRPWHPTGRTRNMAYETVNVSIEDGVAEITLNRPDRLNAWTDQLGTELRKALLEDAGDPSVRAVLITGAGRGFSSGADVKEMLERGA